MTSDKNLIELAKVDGKDLVFERHGDKCWINLTRIAQQFGKDVREWTKQKGVKEYLGIAKREIQKEFLEKQKGQTPMRGIILSADFEPIITRKGGNNPNEQGTWATDTRVARRFFQWLSTEYAWAVDNFLDRIARGELVVSDNSTFLFRGKKWISCAVYCKQFGKSMNSIFGLKAHYPYSFMYVDNQWYMNPELFGMKEAQARFESRRLEVRAQNEDRQLSIQFPETEPNAKED